MSTPAYAIAGMTCGHCAAAGTAGTLTVATAGTVDAQIARAVDEAGYTLVGRK